MKNRLVVLAAFLLLAAFTTVSQETPSATRLTNDHYFDFERLSNAQISPDGAHIVYARQQANKIEDRWDSSLWIMNADGSQHPGLTSSEVDAQRFFDGTPVLGPKFAKTLITQESVPGQATEDHMVLANFEVSEAKLQARKRFFVRIEEVDGKVFELPEK